jgi:DnaJ-class molecular chaperone
MAKKGLLVLILTVFAVGGAVSVYAATRCLTCSGTGSVIHSSCGGTGRGNSSVQHANGSRTYSRCVGCNGRGYVSCYSCGGKGWR